MRGYFCVGFIDFILKVKSLLDHTKLFSPNEYEKNGKIILKSFQQLVVVRKKSIVLSEYLKTLKYHLFSIKH